MSDFRPTLCLDYDGVVNPYSRGWQGGELYETTVTAGFFEWALKAQEQFKLVIYSSRSKDETLLRAMQEWMHQRYAEWVKANELDLAIPVIEIEYAHEKPAAWLTIDDRAIRFDGDWGAPELSPEAMRAYRPWNAPAPLTEASGAVRRRLVTDNNVMGQLARWAVQQHPYGRPLGLFDLVQKIWTAAQSWDIGPPSCKMREFSGWREFEQWLVAALADDPILKTWNTPRSGHEQNVAVSRYWGPKAEDDFIDIDALVRNVARSVWAAAGEE